VTDVFSIGQPGGTLPILLVMAKSPKAPVQNAGAPQDAGKSNDEQEIRKKSEKKNANANANAPFWVWTVISKFNSN
jgi:hypothetical protein